MISKELDAFEAGNSWEKNGRKAEDQIAFYLRRRFHSDEEIFVINGLRFRGMDQTFTQIDHLVLCQYGIVIIESKSVTSVVKYDVDGQWLRLWNNHWSGMPSPIQQARNQEVALREILQVNKEKLREKFVFGLKQGGFHHMPIHILVAISDTGRIMAPPGKNEYAGIVLKADQVADKIISLQKDNKKAEGVFTTRMPPWSMSSEDLKKTVSFLLQIHEPLIKETATEAPPVEESAKEPEKAKEDVPPRIDEQTSEQKIESMNFCPECHGGVTILWGAKYKNYYWHCRNCNKNFPINYKCPGCSEKLRIRKQANEYYIYCDPCGLSALYFTDKS
jgi:transcription elongation factor Elf1